MKRIEEFKKQFPNAPEGGTAQKLWELAWNTAIHEAIKKIDDYSNGHEPTARAYAINITDELEEIL